MVKKKNPVLSEKDYFDLASEYSSLSQQIKVLEARKKELSDTLKKGAEKLGTVDDKGSYYFESDSFIIGKVAKKSFKINQSAAVEKLKSLGLSDCVVTQVIESVDEDKLNTAVQSGKISLNDVEKFTDCTTSYSVLVKEKEPLAEIEQTNLVAAKKRGK